MNEHKIAEYRAAAAKCREWAAQEVTHETKLRWQKIAEDWTRMADDLERKLNPPGSGN